jgi:FtsZ-binding cell division protein ZapB
MAAPTIEDTGLPRDLCWLIKKMDYEWPKIEGWFTENVFMGLVKRGSCKILTPKASIDNYDDYLTLEYNGLDENTEYEILVQNRRPDDVILRRSLTEKIAVQIPAWGEHRMNLKTIREYHVSLNVEAPVKPNRWKTLPDTTVYFRLFTKAHELKELKDAITQKKTTLQWRRNELAQHQQSAKWANERVQESLRSWLATVDALEAAEKALANFS